MDAKNSLAVGYVRVSTFKQEKSGYSLEHQETQIRNYCEVNGMQLVNVYFEQASGGNDSREMVAKAIDEVKKNGGTLVAVDASRIARSARKTLEIVECVPLEFVAYGKMAGKMMIMMTAMFAEMELDSIKERNQKAYVARRARNVANGLPENHGFGNGVFIKGGHWQKVGAELGRKSQSAKAKAKHEKAVEIIKLLATKYGWQPVRIAKDLHQRHGIGTKHGTAFQSGDVTRLYKRYVHNELPKVGQKPKHETPKGQNLIEYINTNKTGYILDQSKAGVSFQAIAGNLNKLGIKTDRKGKFHAQTIKRILEKI
jgi:Resolvase, N terminal domain/Recombinase